MTTKPIRWGVLAPGHIAHKFVQDLQHVADSKLTAVASRDIDRAQTFANQYGAIHAYGSYEELLTCPELDVIYVASPHISHYEHTLMCLQAGKAVLCEKPFGMNATQVNEMIAVAAQNKVFLMEALWSRFMPTTLKTLEIIQSGVIGKVIGVKADFGFKAPFDPQRRTFNKKLGGGALLDIGIYPLFWSYIILGMPSKMTAEAIFGKTHVDETTTMMLTYPNQNWAMLDCTFQAKTRCEATVFGEHGNIYVHPRWHESKGLTIEYHDGTTEQFTFDRPTWGYQYEIEEVNKCLANSQIQSDIWTWQDSKNLIKLLDDTCQIIGLDYDV